MGRTDAVTPLLGSARHAEVAWQSNPKSQITGIADRTEGHMRASHRDNALPRSAVRSSHPRPPFRSPLPGWVRLPGWYGCRAAQCARG